jgi:hypothetical protein
MIPADELLELWVKEICPVFVLFHFSQGSVGGPAVVVHTIDSRQIRIVATLWLGTTVVVRVDMVHLLNS